MTPFYPGLYLDDRCCERQNADQHLPPSTEFNHMDDEQTLIKFCHELSYEDLSYELVEHVKLIALDSIGVIAAGFNLNPIYKKWAKTYKKFVFGRSTILGVGLKTDADYAALANGIAGSSLELDEGNRFCAGHPAMHVIPAALAISEAQSNNGKEFITAVIAGYEAAAKVGRASEIAKAAGITCIAGCPAQNRLPSSTSSWDMGGSRSFIINSKTEGFKPAANLSSGFNCI